MARTKAISLINSSGGKVDLSEVSGFIVENLSADTLAFQLKNQSYTGNPTAREARGPDARETPAPTWSPEDPAIVRRYAAFAPAIGIV